MIWLSEHGNHRDELQDGKIRTSINGKSNDGKTTKSVRASTARTIMLNSHYKHQWHGQWCDGISTNINGKSHNTRKLARVSMVPQVNQHTHRKMRTRSTTNISGNSNDAIQWCEQNERFIKGWQLAQTFFVTHTPGYIWIFCMKSRGLEF